MKLYVWCLCTHLNVHKHTHEKAAKENRNVGQRNHRQRANAWRARSFADAVVVVVIIAPPLRCLMLNKNKLQTRSRPRNNSHTLTHRKNAYAMMMVMMKLCSRTVHAVGWSLYAGLMGVNERSFDSVVYLLLLLLLIWWWWGELGAFDFRSCLVCRCLVLLRTDIRHVFLSIDQILNTIANRGVTFGAHVGMKVRPIQPCASSTGYNGITAIANARSCVVDLIEKEKNRNNKRTVK